ncbi:hypothetical protein BVRB_9g207650 [Beta vulgaris subsp. vulgaris]|uniref:uncharacterized protein LOC104903192 isoform X1 n=1 Tax=Beta vulgaris subsp. vulgaris TaxID=3555 RepID=UPI00053F69CD|nr:uncharacterized protein LOC104903192 isoform X1 [Beta vulgaris subsp. vulgaris]KMT02122.1 hypothetical protein BVRB_9g207650 [Beta vulgaris subsp. vulgaris]
MSISIPNLFSPPKCRNYPHPPLKITTLLGGNRNTNQTLQFNSSTPNSSFTQRFGFCHSRAKLGFCVRAQNVGGERKSIEQEKEDKALEELRGKSTMPDRFKYLTKEVPSPPLRWPWLIALPFLIYAWRLVLWELSNWRNLFFGIFPFVGYILKLILALIYRFIGDPITYTVLYVETAVHATRSLYSSIVTSAPIPELTFIIMLSLTVLAIGEAASPNSIKCQPYLLTAAGLIGYGAVRGVIIEPLFWLMLVGLFSFSRFFKKRDYVSSALPIATVLASVGEPWVRVLAIISFTALAIHHHSKELAEGNAKGEVTSSSGNIPLPLLGVALAIGIRVAAKWAGYRHLTWMIV